MSDAKTTTSAAPGVAHLYNPKLIAFEHARPSTSFPSAPPPPNLLLFIGGLTDGLLTGCITRPLSALLPPTYSLAEILLTSSYAGWGCSSIAQDAEEIAECVKYFREHGKTGKIVLMGHSTGCQDVMEYLTGSGHENREPVQGAIMQAGVSDREAAEMMFCPQDLKTTNALAKKMVDEGRGEDVLPMEKTAAFFGTAVCARRWLDLASPDHQGADDMFSSDLTDEQFAKTFGTLKGKAKLCILYGGNDEFVPPKVDKEGLVQRWASIVKKTGGSIDEENSGIIEGATHDYKEAPKEVFDELTRRVLGFLEGLEK